MARDQRLHGDLLVDHQRLFLLLLLLGCCLHGSRLRDEDLLLDQRLFFLLDQRLFVWLLLLDCCLHGDLLLDQRLFLLRLLLLGCCWRGSQLCDFERLVQLLLNRALLDPGLFDLLAARLALAVVIREVPLGLLLSYERIETVIAGNEDMGA